MNNYQELVDIFMDELPEDHPWIGKVKGLVEKLIENGVKIPVCCKDCKYFVQGEPYDPCECMKWKVKWGAVYTTPDGYCHKAERKDNG